MLVKPPAPNQGPGGFAVFNRLSEMRSVCLICLVIGASQNPNSTVIVI